jgi:hypothetical protein
MISLLADLVLRRVCTPQPGVPDRAGSGQPCSRPGTAAASASSAAGCPSDRSPPDGLAARSSRARPAPFYEPLRKLLAELAWRRVCALEREGRP